MTLLSLAMTLLSLIALMSERYLFPQLTYTSQSKNISNSLLLPQSPCGHPLGLMSGGVWKAVGRRLPSAASKSPSRPEHKAVQFLESPYIIRSEDTKPPKTPRQELLRQMPIKVMNGAGRPVPGAGRTGGELGRPVPTV